MIETKGRWWDVPWNFITGCTPISEGCEHCYAKSMALRFPQYNKFKITEAKDADGNYRMWVKPDKPQKIFVLNMSDFFHKDISDDARSFCTHVMYDKNNVHNTFFVLTKRSKEMKKYFNTWATGYCLGEAWRDKIANPLQYTEKVQIPWVFWGITAENQKRYDERMSDLKDIPTLKMARKFISLEPLLGQIDVGEDIKIMDWVIIGGESGSSARTINPVWVHSIMEKCKQYNIPVFFKGWGSKKNIPDGETKFTIGGKEYFEYPQWISGETYFELPKKAEA